MYIYEFLILICFYLLIKASKFGYRLKKRHRLVKKKEDYSIIVNITKIYYSERLDA